MSDIAEHATESDLAGRYHRDGYVVLSQALSTAEVQALREEAVRICRGELGAVDGVLVAQQTSANVQTVAAATEELSISVREIAAQIAQSSSIAERAVIDAERTNGILQMLAGSAEKIGHVV